jgi:hypothetical protein
MYPVDWPNEDETKRIDIIKAVIDCTVLRFFIVMACNTNKELKFVSYPSLR